jgi:hypothetical protein
MKRRICRVVLAALIAGITLLFPLLAPPAHRIDEAHFKLIDKGMTLAQVEGIFGGPPGEYDWAEADGGAFWSVVSGRRLAISSDFATRYYVTSARMHRYDATLMVLTSDPMRRKVWTSRHGSFEIQLDEHDQVAWINHWPEVRIVPPWERWWRAWNVK